MCCQGVFRHTLSGEGSGGERDRVFTVFIIGISAYGMCRARSGGNATVSAIASAALLSLGTLDARFWDVVRSVNWDTALVTYAFVNKVNRFLKSHAVFEIAEMVAVDIMGGAFRYLGMGRGGQFNGAIIINSPKHSLSHPTDATVMWSSTTYRQDRKYAILSPCESPFQFSELQNKIVSGHPLTDGLWRLEIRDARNLPFIRSD